MRIAYLANATIPSRQANTIHVMQMANALLELGHDVRLYTWLSTSLDMEVDLHDLYGVNHSVSICPYKSLPGRRLTSLSVLFSISSLKSWSPRLVIGRNPKACAYAALFGFPTIFEMHQPISWYPKPDQFLIRIMLKSRNFIGIVTISNVLKEILVQEAQLKAERFLVLHDAASPRVDSVKEISEHRNRLKVGYVGHLYEGRGIEIIMALSKRMPDYDFHVVGGTDEDLNFWKPQANDLSNLTFHGFIPPSQVAGFQSSCDILLAPYQEQVKIPGGRSTAAWMSPLKIFEYMASGRPFIASDLPVLREVLDNNKNCLMVPPDSIDAWEAAIRKLSDINLRKRLADFARQDFEKNYTWKGRAEKIIAFGSVE